ncbi:9255_t:CDS:2, partial [Racocetra fulgida]
ELSGVEFLHLRMAADKFLPEKVIDNLQLFMEQKLEEFVQNDAVGMLQEVFKHNNSIYNPLRDSCLRLICRNPNALFDHPNFTQLDEALLLIVLQLDDLGKLSEITILTYLIKWGMARILNVTTKDITKLQKSDYIELQKIIMDCIPLIRWFQIPITEFRQNLSWIEKLLPSKLYLDIVNYHFDNTITPESVKILPIRNLPPKDTQEIPKKYLYTSEISPDKLNGVEILQLLVTADELQLQNLVDNFQSFMNQKLEEIMHYTTMAHYAKSDKNFLFFFESADDLSRSNFARVKKDSYAVEYSSLNGPIFGHSDYKEGYDMCIYNNMLSFGRRSCYPDSKNFPKLPKFEIEDYEVWQITYINIHNYNY